LSRRNPLRRLMLRPLTTQLVGSYTKPDWLIRHQQVTSQFGDDSFWRPEAEVREQAFDDATRLAIADQERAGLDLVTDGEQRRQRYDTYFFRFGGLDTENLALWDTARRDLSFVDVDPVVAARLTSARVARVVGDLVWHGPTAVNDLRFLKHHTRRRVKMTVIGPLTTTCRLANEHYADEEALGMAVAAVINRELRALDAEGVDVLQVDEPDFHFRHDQASRWGTRALNAALEGVSATSIVHVCYGYATIGRKRRDPNYARVLEWIADSRADGISLEYEQPGHGPDLLRHCGDKAIVLGVLNLGTQEVETPAHIAARVSAALEVVPPERLHLAPDCGMWFLPRDVAFAKLRAMATAAEIVRCRLGGPQHDAPVVSTSHSGSGRTAV
jgi:5-methyltetrahydropteroyltriglutamate--homocysteine methyltransferase